MARPRTRIVCTIGPATGTVEGIRGLIEAGMSVARLNLSHGDQATHHKYVSNARQAAGDLGVTIGVLADLPGPRYRLGEVAPDGIALVEGAPFTLTIDKIDATSERASVWPAGLLKDVPPGGTILIDDGAVELKVEAIAGSDIRCSVSSVSAPLRARKAVTSPGHVSTLDYLSEETSAALRFASDANVDFVGLSYIRSVDDLLKVRQLFADAGFNPQLISKIELPQAVANLSSILDASDGVMVARGDLGVEMPLAEVPGVQKRIIHDANEAGKPVITATQMLESMIEAPHPTRAEATDVHNAVRDGTDAIMLSGETSIGKYPRRTVEYMAEIARKAEEEIAYERLGGRRHNTLIGAGQGVDDAIAYSASQMATTLGAKVILAFTESGSTAARVASYRPRAPILALVQDPSAGKKLALRWGVTTVPVERFTRVQDMFYVGSNLARQTGYAEDGELAIAVVGMPIGVPGNTNLLRVIRIPEPAPAE